MERDSAHGSIPAISDPDWEIKATLPARARLTIQLALRWALGTWIPLESGPRMRRPWDCDDFCRTERRAAAPPGSRAADMMIAACVPRLPSASTRWGRVSGGVQRTASWGASGRSSTDR